MDLTTLKEILIAYIPSLTVLLGFLGSCMGVIKCLKKSNLEDIKNQISESNSEINTKIRAVLDMAEQLAQENMELKKLNAKLLEELTRIADYKEA